MYPGFILIRWVRHTGTEMISWPGQGGSFGWSVLPYTERLPVRFPVRAHARVAGLVPSRGVHERQPIDVSLSHRYFSSSLPLFLKLNK